MLAVLSNLGRVRVAKSLTRCSSTDCRRSQRPDELLDESRDDSGGPVLAQRDDVDGGLGEHRVIDRNGLEPLVRAFAEHRAVGKNRDTRAAADEVAQRLETVGRQGRIQLSGQPCFLDRTIEYPADAKRNIGKSKR